MNTPLNSKLLDSSGRRIVVDPVTRIEGHMRCEVNVDDNNIIVVNKTIVRCTGQNDFGHPAVYLKIKEKFNIKQSAKDLLITSQLRSALIFNDKIKATNYQIDTYKRKIYIYGIAMNSEEKNLVVQEAKEILDVENVIASILLVEDLRIKKN